VNKQGMHFVFEIALVLIVFFLFITALPEQKTTHSSMALEMKSYDFLLVLYQNPSISDAEVSALFQTSFPGLNGEVIIGKRIIPVMQSTHTFSQMRVTEGKVFHENAFLPVRLKVRYP
jgi:hypothetical protein